MESNNQPADGTTPSVDLKALLEKFQLPGLDIAGLIEWQRKDMETLVEANRQAYAGVTALVARRNEILQETLAQWQAAIKDATGADGLAKQAVAAKAGVEKALANFSELSEMEAQARNNTWKVVQDRLQENLGNLQKLLQPK